MATLYNRSSMAAPTAYTSSSLVRKEYFGLFGRECISLFGRESIGLFEENNIGLF